MYTHISLNIFDNKIQVYFLLLFTFIYAEHPSLFFSQSDIPNLRQKAQSTHSEIYKPIKDYADKLKGTTPAEYPPNPGYNPFRDGGNMLIPMVVTYVITGDTVYAGLTRRCRDEIQ